MTGKDNEELVRLLMQPNQVRNLCIMAHVDHGKTTLADALIASNGIINQRLAGKIKYMDCLKDEMERGITMKSSCVTLKHQKEDQSYVVNLIDSPGHVDFSSEVSTAVRLCDGTIIVVDVVEGVCAQTKVVLRQAWIENIRPVLVLNKIDRLILEIQMSPLDAYYHIAQVLERVNAYMGELHNIEVLGRMAQPSQKKSFEQERRISQSMTTEVTDIFAMWGIDDVDDSDLYFSPNHGNVVFSSAIDGWGFSIHHFADQFATKVGMRREVLEKTLWGDYYMTSKNGKKRIVKGARDKRKNTLFVTLILDNIYKLYDVINNRKDKEETIKLAECLGVKMPTNIAKSTDCRYKINYICSKWLPLASAVLDMVVDHLPAASAIDQDRAMKLMCSATQSFSSLPICTQKLSDYYTQCSNSNDVPVIVYVSKMFTVPKKHLVNSKIVNVGVNRALTDSDVAARREAVRKRIADNTGIITLPTITPVIQEEENQQKEGDQHVFVAFARVFSGTLYPGQQVYVLGPKHDPSKLPEDVLNNGIIPTEELEKYQYIQKCQIENVYLLIGRELERISCAPAGCVVGLTGLSDVIIKSATLSTTCSCPPFTELNHHSTPILRVAVEPEDPRDFQKLRVGLKLLNQADPCVQVLLQDTGEYVIITAGEVHLERCITDLQENYAGIKIQVSAPIVPFRETIIARPKFDRMNEMIEGENINTKQKDDHDPLGILEVSSRAGTICLRAVALPSEVTEILTKHVTLLKLISESSSQISLNKSKESSETNDNFNRQTNIAIKNLRSKLLSAFQEDDNEWGNIVDCIWSCGPQYCGPNILFNQIDSYDRPSIWEKKDRTVKSPLYDYDSNFITGFQLAMASGPLCEEPMIGVGFVVEQWQLPECQDNLSGQVISLAKDSFRKALEQQPLRLVWAMYSCSINVTSDGVGKMYTVIGKRQGRIVDGDITEGSTSWNVTAYLPVIESLDFANELRKSTSGEAMPQLMFSHWETLDIDPFWEPQTTEELAHWGEKSDSGNIARKYINQVRKRKGLFIENKIVEFAEKQRTLSKNK